MGNAGRSAQSLPSSQSEFSATAQVPRPAAPKAFAPEQKASDKAPSEQTPSYEVGHVFEHFIVAASFIALARSPDDRGMLSITPRPVRISSSGFCGCGIGEASGIGGSAAYGATVAPLRESSRSSGSTMSMLSLLSRSGITSAGRGRGEGASATRWSASSVRACGASALQRVARIDQRASARGPQRDMRTHTRPPALARRRAAKVTSGAILNSRNPRSDKIDRYNLILPISVHGGYLDSFIPCAAARRLALAFRQELHLQFGGGVGGQGRASSLHQCTGTLLLLSVAC